MSEGTAVEAAIRAWEVARKVEDDARKAVFEARAALALANRALDEAGAREDEARSAAIPLMASGDDGPVGWIVDGCVYYPVESLGEIRSIRIAHDTQGGGA